MNCKKFFIWSPFTSRIGTTKNVINSSYSLIKYSKSKLYDVNLINVFGEWDSFINEDKLKGVKIENLKFLSFIKSWNKEGYIKSRLASILIFIFAFFQLVELIKKKKPDFLIIHLITSLPLIVFFFYDFKTKLILNIAGHPKLNFFRKFIWKLSSKKIFKVVCPSKELKYFLLDNNIFDENKIEVIEDPHLITSEIQKFKKAEFKDTFFDDNKILISIGRLTRQKNYPFLIRNFKKLFIRYNNIKLLIIGSGEQKIFIEKLIKDLCLQDKIKLISYEKNIYQYLKKSNYYISTSIWEGSSLAMVDAAYMGIPILCSDCPTGRKEFIGNDEKGFLYKENDDDDFLNKFSKMYEINPSILRNKLVSAKVETKKFTLLKNYLKIQNMLN